MKRFISLVLALVVVVTAIPFTAVAAEESTLYMGDADGNGSVTAMDARIVLQVVAGLKTISDDALIRIDMNGDGKITAIDARKVLQTAAESVDKIPADPDVPEVPVVPDVPGEEPEEPDTPAGPIAPETQEELREILRTFGYEYDAEQDIFYTHLYPWQRNFGFADIYDNAAAYAVMWYQTLKIDFEYQDLLWRLQWWKGQYGVLEGAELGVYTKDPKNTSSPFYECAADEHLLEMYFEYYHSVADYNEGNILFTRYEQRHWWLTGFKFGVVDPTKNVLKAYVIAWDDEMADGIEEGLKNVTDKTGRPNGFKPYRPWLPLDMQGKNFYIREKLDDGRTKFTVVWKDAGYLNYGEEHQCEFGEPVVVKEPTCSEDGIKRATCTICEYYVDEPIPATGIHEMGAPYVAEVPTCVAEGIKRTPCMHCDYYEDEVIPATGIHILKENITEPTCSEDGLKQTVCENCDYCVEEVLPATGIHEMGTAQVIATPNCGKDGLSETKCNNCDYVEQTVLPATGLHILGLPKTVTKPTCTTDGLRTQKCIICGHIEETVLPATGHSDDCGHTV